MRIRCFLVLVALAALLPSFAFGQTATPTNTPTPTNTHTPTSTPTGVVAIPTVSRDVKSKLQDFAPAAKMVRFGDLFGAVVNDTNASIKMRAVAGIDGSGGGAQYLTALRDPVAEIEAILAVTTSSGAMATKALLAPTTDYVVGADGSVEIVTNQSANTLLVFYRRK